MVNYLRSSAGFRATTVCVIQSLPPRDVATGVELVGYIKSIADEHQFNVEFANCIGADSFLDKLKELEIRASNGEIPILHVECHGCPLDGLCFADGTTLDWDNLSLAILPINVETGFNLLVVFSACYGAYMLSQTNPEIRSPFWGLVGPTKRVPVPEVMSGFKTFYRFLISTGSLTEAKRELQTLKLPEGEWLVATAELFYEVTIRNFIKKHCSAAAIKKSTKIYIKNLKSGKASKCHGSPQKHVRKLIRESLCGPYFDKYFCIDIHPGSTTRFESSRLVICELSRSI